MRWWALVFLSGCLVFGGTASAVPMIGMAMESTKATSMAPDCPDMAVAVPVVDDGAVPVDVEKPSCCQRGGCACAAAHGAFLSSFLFELSRPGPSVTTVAAIGVRGYTSPARAALIRPPIS